MTSIDTGLRHEIVLFRFLPDCPYEQQHAYMDAMAAWLARQPGYLRRQCFYEEGQNRWIDIVTWQSLAFAEQAMARSLEDPDLQPVLANIDSADITMGHYVQVA
ncbi:MAG: hypothetical protein ACLGI6_03985 [Gammaproteobacteria bacterium]